MDKKDKKDKMDNEKIMAGNMRVLMGKDVGNESYSDTNHNYVAPGELTVTITLGEYRNLIKSSTEVYQLRSDNYILNQEKDKLQKQLDACKKELIECKIKLELFHQIPKAASTMTPEVSTEESTMSGESTEKHVFVEDAGEN